MTDARSLVRGLGNSKSPLYFVLIACIINIGVDFLLVGGFGLRAAGAAIATVLSQGISFLTALWFLHRRGFHLYIGAGGQIEKCVYAKFGSKVVTEHGVQWSAFGVAGAEYRFGRTVGLYFEPELSYYFTRTELRKARTDDQLTRTLRLGLSFSF